MGAFRLDLQFVKYSKAVAMIKADPRWRVAREEDNNRMIGCVWIEQIELPMNTEYLLTKATMEGYVTGLADNERRNPYPYISAEAVAWERGFDQGLERRKEFPEVAQ